MKVPDWFVCRVRAWTTWAWQSQIDKTSSLWRQLYFERQEKQMWKDACRDSRQERRQEYEDPEERRETRRLRRLYLEKMLERLGETEGG